MRISQLKVSTRTVSPVQAKETHGPADRRYAHENLRASTTAGRILGSRRRFDHPGARGGDAVTVSSSTNGYRNQRAVWIEPTRSRDTDFRMAVNYKEHRSEPDARDRLIGVLRRHVGSWVAIKGPEVLVASSSPSQVIRFLRAHNLRADSVFRVPGGTRHDVASEG